MATMRTNRVVTMTTGPTPPAADLQDDFQAFQMRPVIKDFKLSAELFASNGDIVLICGRGTQEQQRMLLVSYEIPSAALALAAGIRLLKVIKLTKRSVTQLETVPIMKIALLLGDGIVSILDIDSLAELTTVSSNVILFSTSYDVPSVPTTPTTPAASSTPTSTSSTSSFNYPAVVPSELRICVASKRNSLGFFRWFPQQKRAEEDKNLRGAFDLLDTPRTIAFSRDRICIGYKKSYVIMSLATGMIINELTFTMTQNPLINCLQDRTQWCIQMEANTVFLNSNFEPLYESGIPWRDIPSAVVQSSPYVLALMNQSIDICTFNGSQSVPVQQIPQRGATAAGKCRLWMDARTERIYAATPTDVVLLEPILVHIQLQNYTGMYRYDLALILIRAVLGISVSSTIQDQSRMNDGHAKGNLDASIMPKVVTYENNEQVAVKSLSDNSVSRQSSLSESSRQSLISSSSRQSFINGSSRQGQSIDDAVLWSEYYRVGTMYAFQLFHKQQFEQAFAEFNEFLTDPAEIISLFKSLSGNAWLTNSYNDLTKFVEQHRHFGEPNDFVGVKLELALRELQRYLTDLRRVFQTFYRRSPDSWLEVQSLVQNGFVLKPVRDLLIMVETALLKTYLIDNNNTLANALLRNQDNCCLPSEVEKELKSRHRRNELVAFYERQNRHRDALHLLTNTESMSSNETILNYLSKLDNDQLPLISEYVNPMIHSALEGNKDEDLLREILTLFIGEPTPGTPSGMDPMGQRTIKLDPIAVHEFLKNINQDFAMRYLEEIRFKPELGTKQREIHTRLVFAYCDRLKQLSKKLKQIGEDKEQSSKNKRQDTYQDDDFAASETSGGWDNHSSEPTINKQIGDYSSKLKNFLLEDTCQCDFDRLEAFFLHEQTDRANQRLFSLPYAIVLGKLGRNQAALETFLKNGYYTDAEHYCETIYNSGKVQLARELYGKLIEFYLKKSNDGSLSETSLKTILRIVNNYSERLDPAETLKSLPGQLKLNTMTDFIEHSLQTCSTKKRRSQLERNLLFLKLLRTQSTRIASENHAFTIEANTRCARRECTQPFNATQAVVRFPDGRIVHLHCRARYEIEREKSNKKR